jgi:hypothetical protein
MRRGEHREHRSIDRLADPPTDRSIGKRVDSSVEESIGRSTLALVLAQKKAGSALSTPSDVIDRELDRVRVPA